LRGAAAYAPRLRLARVLGEPISDPTFEQRQADLDAARTAHVEAVADDKAVEVEIARLKERVGWAKHARRTSLDMGSLLLRGF
jgi:hypothetical protein